MSQLKVKLPRGYQVGDDRFNEVVIRPYTTSDLIDAEAESERLETVVLPEGGLDHKLVLSPSLYGLNIFRRQIVSIGDIEGPFEVDEIKKLHPDDFVFLQQKVEALESASDAKEASKAVTQKGKP